MTARLFILAGEASGDVIGADLLRGISAQLEVKATGVGGEQMLAAGLEPIFPIDALSVMGFVDVALRLPGLLMRVRQTVRHILDTNPDLVVLIDSQVFSKLVAKGLRKRGYKKPILLYVAPSVWAWRPERAPGLVGLYDEILAVLPFEPRALAELGGPPTTYVGHPAARKAQNAEFAQLPDRGPLLLLPGSRRGELRRHMPLFEAVAARLAGTPGIAGFAIPTLSRHKELLETMVSGWPVRVEIVTEPERRDALHQQAVAALASAGTVTLELALAGVPFVGAYSPDRFQMRAYEKAGKPLILLPNIILGQQLVPEIQPGEGLDRRLAEQIARLVNEPTLRAEQRAGFSRMKALLNQGEPPYGKKDAVSRVLSYLQDGTVKR